MVSCPTLRFVLFISAQELMSKINAFFKFVYTSILIVFTDGALHICLIFSSSLKYLKTFLMNFLIFKVTTHFTNDGFEYIASVVKILSLFCNGSFFWFYLNWFTYLLCYFVCLFIFFVVGSPFKM